MSCMFIEGAPRLGLMRFINCFPFRFGMEALGYEGVHLELGVPTGLNQQLLEHRLDVSFISSIAYARHDHQLLLLPDLSIAGDGAVVSVVLLSAAPIDRLNGQLIYVTALSATSTVLLDIILRRRYRLEARYAVLEEAGAGAGEAAAYLLIGDEALEAQKQAREDGEFPWLVYDLGAEWKQLTGLPMVFGVAAIHRATAESRRDLGGAVQRMLTASEAYSRRHREEMVAALAAFDYSAAFLYHYYQQLHYDLSEEKIEGLQQFYRYACELKHIAAEPALHFLT